MSMKTIMKYFGLPGLFVSGLIFAGCYTQLQSMNGDDADGSNDDPDSSYAQAVDTADGGQAGNYFADDDYRAWRYRMAFDYYTPSPYGWGASYGYDPWYDDNWYPYYSWYDAGFWYPTLVYPYPYWYPHHGYHNYFYAGYYGGWNRWGGGYHGGFASGRQRFVGNSRGTDALYRPRGSAGAGPSSVASGEATGRSRPSTPTEAAPAPARSRSRASQEVPWWERMNNSSAATSARSRVATGSSSPQSRGNVRGEARAYRAQPRQRGHYSRPSGYAPRSGARAPQGARSQRPSGGGAHGQSPRSSPSAPRGGGGGGRGSRER